MDDFEIDFQRMQLRQYQNKIEKLKNAIEEHKKEAEEQEEYSEINKKLWKILEN